MACFLLTNSHKIFDSFFFLRKKKKKRIQGEKKETHQERLPYFYVYLCKCSTEDIFRFSAPNPTGALLLTLVTTMTMTHVCD